MTEIGRIARIVVDAPSGDNDDIRDAWLLWKSVTGVCERNDAPRTDNGYWVYYGSLRSHVQRLWPMADSEQRRDIERRLYSFLSRNELAHCIQRKDPTTWHIAMTWSVIRPDPVRYYRPTQTERRLTEHEAGEDRTPGEVITKTKGTQQVPSIEPLLETQRKRQEERDARREKLIEVVLNANEPMVVGEVAHLMQTEISTVRKDLSYLVEQGLLYARTETDDERKIRFGGRSRATRAALYWHEAPVPARTQRVLVEGYVAELPEVIRQTNGAKANNLIWEYLRGVSSRKQFTARMIANAQGIGYDLVRRRLNDLADAGLIRHVGHINSARSFVVGTDRPAIRELLGVQDALPITVPEPAPAPKQREAAPATLDKEVNDLISQVLERDEKLEQRVKELEAENAALRERLEELSKPASAADPALVERLRRAAGRGLA